MKNKEELEKKTGVKKFDICLMNPPYADKEANRLDVQFVSKVNKISNINIAIYPERLGFKYNYDNVLSTKTLKSLELIKASDYFDINSWQTENCGIYEFHNNETFEEFDVTDRDGNTQKLKNSFDATEEYSIMLRYPHNIIEIIKSTKDLYNKLLQSNKSMIHDCKDFIYEENKDLVGVERKYKKGRQVKLTRVKKYLTDGTYKYCIYKGSGNNEYDEVKEWKGQDVNKLFNGQICWLTNSKNVKENIRYWLESPLCDLWRRFYFKGSKYAACSSYRFIPALNFEMNTSDFKDYVDSLYDFSDNEKNAMIEYNIHNSKNIITK